MEEDWKMDKGDPISASVYAGRTGYAGGDIHVPGAINRRRSGGCGEVDLKSEVIKIT